MKYFTEKEIKETIKSFNFGEGYRRIVSARKKIGRKIPAIWIDCEFQETEKGYFLAVYVKHKENERIISKEIPKDISSSDLLKQFRITVITLCEVLEGEVSP